MAEQSLRGKKIAILATDGVEQVELTEPRRAFERAGATTELIGLQAGELQGFDHLDPGETFTADKAVADARVEDYDALHIPGGVANGDFLRADEDAVAFVAGFARAGKPIAAICHAPWILAEAGMLAGGRRVTSFPSLQTDLRNAGAEWVDEEVVVDRGLVTSRKPDDIPAYNAKAIEEFAEGEHEDIPQPDPERAGRFARGAAVS